jgi:hypothetical protein
MEYLKVIDWDKYQSYRADRGTPPWIKVHRRLMSSAKWAGLKDQEKGHLISIWLVAADRDGVVPSDPNLLRKVCMLDDCPDVENFIELGYLRLAKNGDDVSVTSTWRQTDAPEAETETETETETELYGVTNDEKPTKKTKTAVKKVLGKTKRKTSLKADWILPDDYREYCVKKRPELNPEDTAEDFKEFYISHGRTMANWKMTWQRWVRNERRGKHGNTNQPETPLDRADRIIRNKEVVS